MLKVTCYKCHWSWSLNNESVQSTLDELKEGEQYYALECPKCRRINKITENQLRRALPRQASEETKPD